MFKKKWQQPLIHLLEVGGKVWDRQEAGQKHHIGTVPNKGARNQVHYTQNKNAKKIENVRAPSDVAKGSMVYPIVAVYPPDPGTDTRKVGYGIAHNAGGGGHNPTLYLPDSAVRYIGPS